MASHNRHRPHRRKAMGLVAYSLDQRPALVHDTSSDTQANQRDTLIFGTSGA